MPDGKELIDEMEYDRQITGLTQKELMKFTAKQIYKVQVDIYEVNEHIKRLNGRVDANEKRGILNRYLIYGIIVAMTGGGGFGITKLIEAIRLLGG